MLGVAVGVGVSPFQSGFQGSSRFTAYAPGQTLGGESFTRGSTATYKDINGTRQTAAINQKRDGHYIGGIATTLLEGSRTNHFLNSGAPATQTTAALGIGTYVLWMEGTGSIAVSAGTATITGAGSASAGVPVVFNVTVAGTVTYTVTGAPTLAQAENGAFATSYIPTAGAQVTRSADFYGLPFNALPSICTIYMKFIELGTISVVNARAMQISSAANASPRANILAPAGFYSGHHTPGADVASTLAAAPSIGDTVELMLRFYADGSVDLTQSINGGAAVTAAQSAAAAFAAAWSGLFAWIASAGTAGANGFLGLTSFKALAGIQTLPVMQAA